MTIIETGLSDFHKLTVSVLKTSFRKMPPKIVMYRKYTHYCPGNFANELSYHLGCVDSSNISSDDFDSLVMDIFNRHAPLKHKYVRANDCPFITKELRKEHMKRSRLRNKYLKDKSEANNIAYKSQRNKCVSLLRAAKKSYYATLKPSLVCDNKKNWKTVNPLFNEQTASIDSITLIENDTIVSNDQEVSEIFNEFFGNSVMNLNIASYQPPPFNLHESITSDDVILAILKKYEMHSSVLKIREIFPDINNSFSFKPTDLKSVVDEIYNLDDSKVSPIDSIPSKILKGNCNIFAPKIVLDFNLSIINGVFLKKQKLADITPVFKKLDKHYKINYRPVSILSALSKMSERLMYYQINDYMTNKISIFRGGFLNKALSAQNCLLFMIETWKNTLDNKVKAGV